MTMKKMIKQICGTKLECAFVIGGMLFPAFGVAVEVQNIEFASLPGDQTEIKVSFDEPPPIPRGYTIERPARIALDLDGVTNALEQKHHNLGTGNTRGVTVMEASGRTRMIINLAQLVSYETEVVGNDLIIRVGKDAKEVMMARKDDHQVTFDEGETQASMDKSKSKTISAAKKFENKAKMLTDIDFRRGDEGEGQVVITLSDPTASVDLREESGKIVVEFMDVLLPEQLRRRIDVTDFATAVKRVDAMVEDGNTKLIIHPNANYEYLAYQADNTFTVSVKQVSKVEQDKRNRDKFLYTGEKLSLNFQDIEVRSVLQLIADFTSLNLVASDTVSGKITLRLQNVPWDQALDLILKTKGLDQRKIGNVLLVAPADEIAAREKLELETSRQVEELAPLRTEYVQVNYAKAKDLLNLITGADGSGFLSSRGSATVDDRTNTVLIQDTGSKIEEVRSLFARLDIPVQQVLIEARVVVANANVASELGVRWGGGALKSNGDNRLVVGGSEQTAFDFLTPDDTGTVAVSRTTGAPEYLSVDLGVVGDTASAFSVGFSKLGSGFLSLELSALESDGYADIIATPKVLTADQQTARIASGSEVPYQQATSSGATSVSFKEAALSLEVTPQITPDGRIIMDLQINQDTVGKIYNNIPSIDTNQLKTRVLADDGETIVLGGVFRNQSVNQVDKTPFFGDLPVIGRFFKRTTKTDEKQELLIFITPKLVKNVFDQ